MAFEGGNYEGAAEICRQVVQRDANLAEAHYLLGLVLANQGDLPRAAASLSRAAVLQPGNAVLHCDLGVILRRLGRIDEAIALYQKALGIDPKLVEGHYNLANALHSAGRLDDAIRAFGQCLRIDPGHLNARNNIGLAQLAAGRATEAAGYFRSLIAENGQAAYAHNNLGNALRDLKDLPAAIESYRRAVALQADYSEAHSNLGIALKETGDLAGALVALQRAVEAEPGNAAAQANFGSALFESGDLARAIGAMEKALVLSPQDAMLHWNLALAYLLAGRMAEGWAEYEWRWRKPDFTTPKQNFEQPLWDGGDLRGRKILLHAEQGFGDTIQFIRYAALVQQRGGQVFVVCQPELKRLLQSAAGIDVLAASGETVPMFDVHLPLLSLPHVLGTTLENLPAGAPYLSPPSELAIDLPTSPNFKIGIAWSGSSGNRHDHKRSIELAVFSALFDLEGCDFVSLQVGPQHGDIAEQGLTTKLFDLADRLNDFADTAAVIAQLDLVITVDTAVAHLAGALGRPVWVLLPFSPDWRWLQDRSDSPWYPTMRLFRQPSPGKWPEVIVQVRQALIERIGQSTSVN